MARIRVVTKLVESTDPDGVVSRSPDLPAVVNRWKMLTWNIRKRNANDYCMLVMPEAYSTVLGNNGFTFNGKVWFKA